MPESLRWLIANGRTPVATKILSRYDSGTEQPTELVQIQVAEITDAIDYERSLESASYLHFGFIVQWCGNQLIALVLTDIGITDPETQNLINGGLQIFNWVVAVGSALFVDRLGRRFLLLTSTIGMLIAFSIWTILAARNQQSVDGSKGLGIGVVVMVFVFYAFYNLAMMPLPIAYVLEVLPYTLRAKGLTVFNLAQFCSGIFNDFVNPVALEKLRWKYYIVFICALLLWLCVIYLTYPETRGMTLEEVSQVFDDREALDKSCKIKDMKLAEPTIRKRLPRDDTRSE
ncbi:lactose permease [Colletotrichum spaethianum]|uniref:Lactose permease n=1 Tax=Colletotrichum spaethianum TaxID=700344 RepID=A0AA37PGQ4_9PEZI|nr:lactose permease [Colletotrichum spaethianum]GKT51996.1 lactose permease [Colletotrichum spaethianum]